MTQARRGLCVRGVRVYDPTMIEVRCSQCGLCIQVPETVQGKRGVCFNCGQPVTVPTTGTANRHRDLAFEQGDRVADRYTIDKRVGEGGMGVVYRAQDTLVDEEVALKFMNPRMLRTQSGQRLFIQEAQVARRLRHENIVAVHDVSWTNDGILYLSMEFLEGHSLRAMLRRQRVDRRFLDVRLAVSFTLQVLSALEYAHRMVIHRDIKPENVMVLAGERVKVLDFGLAKAAHEEMMSGEAPEQQTKRVIGTLAYASPEQRRRRTVDQRADLYAVGLLMHELLTLRTPMDEPVTVMQVRDDVAPSVIAALDKALAEEKEDRWHSARDFRLALSEAFEGSYMRSLSHVEAATEGGKQASTEGMVFLDGGSFLMGSNAVREEMPEEEVYVGPFWMDAHPVTTEQYGVFLKETGSAEPRFWRDPRYNGPTQPIVGVTWDEARAYAAWAGKRLPTEDEWEFAARGRENRTYPWGNLPPHSTLCNYGDNLGMPSMVNMHDDGRTPDGIYDLAGNVYEWTLDPYVPYTTLRRAEGPINAPRRSVRGGCWSSPAEELRCTLRRGLFPESRLATVGFRCVLPAATEED